MSVGSHRFSISDLLLQTLDVGITIRISRAEICQLSSQFLKLVVDGRKIGRGACSRSSRVNPGLGSALLLKQCLKVDPLLFGRVKCILLVLKLLLQAG